MTRCMKSFIAHITFVRPLVRVNTHVAFQTTRLTKSFIADITFVRFLVRVNTHVLFQTTRFTKSFIANIAFVRFLVRVNTHVPLQMSSLSKTLLAHIALVLGPLPLRSFLFKSRFFFLYLMMIRLVEIIILVRNPRTRHQRFFFLSLQNRPRVHRSFRMWILSSSAHVVVVPRVSRREKRFFRASYQCIEKKKLRRFSGMRVSFFLFLTKTVCFAQQLNFIHRIFPSLEFSLIQNLLTSLSKLSLSF